MTRGRSVNFDMLKFLLSFFTLLIKTWMGLVQINLNIRKSLTEFHCVIFGFYLLGLLLILFVYECSRINIILKFLRNPSSMFCSFFAWLRSFWLLLNWRFVFLIVDKDCFRVFLVKSWIQFRPNHSRLKIWWMKSAQAVNFLNWNRLSSCGVIPTLPWD